MTAPNLKNPTTITGKTTFVGINTTAKVGILTNLQNSDKVLKVNSIFAANVDGTSDALVNVSIANTVGTASTASVAGVAGIAGIAGSCVSEPISRPPKGCC